MQINVNIINCISCQLEVIVFGLEVSQTIEDNEEFLKLTKKFKKISKNFLIKYLLVNNYTPNPFLAGNNLHKIGIQFLNNYLFSKI